MDAVCQLYWHTADNQEGAMSLYADILRDQIMGDDSDIRQDGETWTIIGNVFTGHKDIPGFPTKDMALAVVRTMWTAFDLAGDTGSYS